MSWGMELGRDKGWMCASGGETTSGLVVAGCCEREGGEQWAVFDLFDPGNI